MNLNTAGWASRALTPLLRIIRSSPNATVPVVVISEPVNSETAGLVNSDIALVAKGAGATLAQVPDGTIAGGNKRGNFATDWQKDRASSTRVASAAYSTIGGGQSNTASGQYSTVAGGDNCTAAGSQSAICGGSSNFTNATQAAICGGLSNTASSNYSFVGGGQSNTASTNSHSTVCGGNTNTASGQQSFVGGGVSCTATNSSAVAVGGNTNSATGSRSSVLGGENNTANAICSVVIGGMRGTTRSISGCIVFPAHAGAINSTTTGASQSALLVIGRQTTDATATVLASDGSAAATTNQVTLPNNSAYSFSGEVIAGVTGAGDSARWTINGAIKRGANAASTAMIGTPTVVMTHFDAGAATWVVAVTANTTLGCITVTVTGAAATTIRWVCKINTTEMTY
jgi:hypothetical protein